MKSKVQFRRETLALIFKKIRQPSVKGLNFTVRESILGKRIILEIFFKNPKGETTVNYLMGIYKKDRRLVCEGTTMYGWDDPKNHVAASKVLRLVGKLYKIFKEFE